MMDMTNAGRRDCREAKSRANGSIGMQPPLADIAIPTGLHFADEDNFLALNIQGDAQEITRKTESVMHTYVFHNRVYCALCIANKPIDLVDDKYGRMHPHISRATIRRGIAALPAHAAMLNVLNHLLPVTKSTYR